MMLQSTLHSRGTVDCAEVWQTRARHGKGVWRTTNCALFAHCEYAMSLAGTEHVSGAVPATVNAGLSGEDAKLRLAIDTMFPASATEAAVARQQSVGLNSESALIALQQAGTITRSNN